ncbi:hypothetical protein LA080_003995 [Diaporthe eres]|nr:hypothetical protein LA080_003995 [Diaporthe eres]
MAHTQHRGGVWWNRPPRVWIWLQHGFLFCVHIRRTGQRSKWFTVDGIYTYGTQMIPREGILNVFAKKSRTHTTARSNAAAYILVGAGGNGRGRIWELKLSEEGRAYLNARCATLGNRARASFAVPAELVRETNTVKSKQKRIPTNCDIYPLSARDSDIIFSRPELEANCTP